MQGRIAAVVCVIALSLGIALSVGASRSFGAEKYVTWLSLADYTGPIAGLVMPADMGCEDYFKNLNDRGGIQGVKIKFIGVDTRYDLARAVSAFKRYRREQKLLMVNGVSTALAKAIRPFLKRDKLIMLTPGDGEVQAMLGRIFLYGVAYQNAFAAALDWMVEDWKKKGKSGKPVVGYIGWDNPYGREALHGGKEYAKKIGVKLLPPEFFPPGSLNHNVWLKRLDAHGANYIYASGVDPTPTNVIRDAHALGLTKKIQMVTDFWGPTMGVGVRLHPKQLEGTVVTSFYVRGAELFKHPVTRLWEKYRKKPVSEMPIAYTYGLMWAATFEAALKKAIKEVGYEKLDGNVMYQTYQKLTGMNTTQGLTGPNAYSPKSRQACKEVRFYRVQSGQMVPISDWRAVPDAVSLYKW